MSPFLILISIVLGIINSGNPFFLQDRPGLDGRIFKIVKFKTMNDKKDNFGNLLDDSQRLTKIGQIIRKLSLDELPQLINVVKGDMSLIGPRPLLPVYLPLYNKDQARRHEVRPGITGWAQVNGRNAITWEKKFELDVWYVENVSFSLDCKIFLMTLKKIFRATDINQTGQATAEKFEGNIK
jgi:undecaprenyl phosphate N,N'-diacetylbacillosamine 1-phosphate transferase